MSVACFSYDYVLILQSRKAHPTISPISFRSARHQFSNAPCSVPLPTHFLLVCAPPVQLRSLFVPFSPIVSFCGLCTTSSATVPALCPSIGSGLIIKSVSFCSVKQSSSYSLFIGRASVCECVCVTCLCEGLYHFIYSTHTRHSLTPSLNEMPLLVCCRFTPPATPYLHSIQQAFPSVCCRFGLVCQDLTRCHGCSASTFCLLSFWSRLSRSDSSSWLQRVYQRWESSFGALNGEMRLSDTHTLVWVNAMVLDSAYNKVNYRTLSMTHRTPHGTQQDPTLTRVPTLSMSILSSTSTQIPPHFGESLLLCCY